MIDEKKLIEDIHNLPIQVEVSKAVGRTRPFVDTADILECVEKQPKIDWIMVSDRLPTREEYLKNDGRFIGCDGNRVYQAEFDIYRNMFVRDCFGCINKEDKCIIKWQPMPEI